MKDDVTGQTMLEAIKKNVVAEGFATGNTQDLLFYIGIKEASLPPRKIYSDVEKQKIIQMATYTILAPARYYELIWVDDQGWPHYRPTNATAQMNETEFELFIIPFILKYFEGKR